MKKLLFLIVFLFIVPAFAQKTLDDYFPFEPPTTRQQWEQRRTELRRQILVSQGLFPLPDKTDLKPIVHHNVERKEYTVSSVILEAVPGFYLTGNLYVPKNVTGKIPAVLSPHGHWNGGRFHQHSDGEFAKEIQTGGEKYDPCGRFPLQARCVTLARLGCIVFHYDMIGYADSMQIQHRPGVREALNTKENWGFFSPQAELRLQNMMGLQTLSSIRALDWLETLPNVDKGRIAITGASGGGTQSFILAAIDDRIAASFPAVMVSTAMQGGCTCENACYLRVGTGNVEMAALFAPKPQGMTAADDWTKEMETKGFPQLQQLYRLYGAKKSVALFAHTQFGHNYNFLSRDDMYRFMNEHLKLGHHFQNPSEPIEQPFQPLTGEEMTVWSGEHRKPSGEQVGDVFERTLLREMDRRFQTQLATLSAGKRREIVRGALETMIGWEKPSADSLTFEMSEATEEPYGKHAKVLLTDKHSGVTVSGIALFPTVESNKKESIFVSKNGISDFFDKQGKPIAEVEKCRSAGQFVILLNLYGQGEKPLEKAVLRGSGNGNEPWQQSLAYTYGYNPTVFSRRVQELMTVLVPFIEAKPAEAKLILYGLHGGAPYTAAARALLGDEVDELIVDTEGFRFAGIESLDDVNMLPGIVKYGDLPAILDLNDPKTTAVWGE
jgi:hypothetical protein